jgi:UDP-glucuronate decarboxylase
MDPSLGPFVLVPGGAGFLGSHLCDRLIARGHCVLAFDDLSTGSRANLQHLQGHARFRLLVGDVADSLPAAIAGARRVFNLACPASPAYYRRDPMRTVLSGVLGTWRLLELCQRTGARLLHASTGEVYGDPQEHPQSEGYFGHVNPIGPRACRAEGQRCAETLCFAYHRQRNVSLGVARVFNTYGPRMRPGDGRAVSNFIVQALRGEPLTIHGDGQQTRSFCYVDDLVGGLVKLMDSPLEGPVNLGHVREHSVLELAELVLRLTGSRSALLRQPLPADDPPRRRPDIGLARRQLGWEPRVALEDGLAETIGWFRHELGMATRSYVGSAAAA